MIRSEAPAYQQSKTIDLVFPKVITTENGGKIYLQDAVQDESVKIDFEWSAGSKFQSKRLVASFVNRMLLAGTLAKSARKIAEEIDFYGGYTQLECDKDHAGFTIYGLSNQMKHILPLVKDAILDAQFPEQQLAKELEIGKSKFQIEVEKVKVLARRKFNQEVFGANKPYGQVADLSDFDALKTQDLISFYNQYYKVIPHVFVTGNVSEEVINLLKDWLGHYQAVSEKNEEFEEYHSSVGQFHVAKEGAIQTSIRVGRTLFDKNYPDYFNFQLLNTVLGGYFGSRLMSNIREDKGYTYGIGSGVSVLQDGAYFFVATEVASDVAENTLKEIKFEFERLRNEWIGEEELKRVKNYMLGEFLRQADGPIAQMEMFKNIFFNELKASYYHDFIQSIHTATTEDLRKVAQRYLNWEEMLIVTAG